MELRTRKYAFAAVAAVAGYFAGTVPLNEAAAPLIALLQLWLNI